MQINYPIDIFTYPDVPLPEVWTVEQKFDTPALTLPQIAEREGISTANAGKLMWLLNKAGFVSSTRGTKGGYSLARGANDGASGVLH